MNWIFLAIIGYTLLAFEAVASKYLLAGKVANWRQYLFYVGLLSLFGLAIIPFGCRWWGWINFFGAFFSGVIFFISLGFLFFSLTTSAASRVYVLFGAVSTLTGFFLLKVFFEENHSGLVLVGIGLLLAGGFFISFKFSERRFFRNYKKTILAGLLAGASLVMLKLVYNQTDFVSGYVFSRLGIFFSALLLPLIPVFNKKIFSEKKKKGRHSPFWMIVPVKILAGAGTVLISYSISAGSLTVVNALVSVQYLLTFFFTLWLAAFFQEFSKEKIPTADIIFKFIGVFLVILGVFGVNFS